MWLVQHVNMLMTFIHRCEAKYFNYIRMKITKELLYEKRASIIMHPDIPLAKNFSVNKLFDMSQ